MQRRLAAVLAADVVGFSALMGTDKEGTLARIESLRPDVIQPKMREHDRQMFNRMGDSFLAEFSSPVDAVRCAIGLQQALGSPEEQSDPVQLRSGSTSPTSSPRRREVRDKLPVIFEDRWG